MTRIVIAKGWGGFRVAPYFWDFYGLERGDDSEIQRDDGLLIEFVEWVTSHDENCPLAVVHIPYGAPWTIVQDSTGSETVVYFHEGQMHCKRGDNE